VGLWDREGRVPRRVHFGRGVLKAHRMYFWEGLSQNNRVALRAPQPSRCATGMDAPFLSVYTGE